MRSYANSPFVYCLCCLQPLHIFTSVPAATSTAYFESERIQAQCKCHCCSISCATAPANILARVRATRSSSGAFASGCGSNAGNYIKHHCKHRSPYKSASRELQSLIQEGSEDAERFGELVDILLDSELPFKESALGNGEWQVQFPALTSCD